MERSLGGISEMKKIPDMIFIIDTNIEELAVKESIKLNIPIVAILDTNSNPDGINYPIPGNDDARRAINLYCDLIKQTILDAQSNMSNEDLSKDNVKLELNNEDSKKVKPKVFNKKEKKDEKSKEKIKVVKKISKSIISKVKSLAKKKI
jgi:small subunit ribosomal protein S2